MPHARDTLEAGVVDADRHMPRSAVGRDEEAARADRALVVRSRALLAASSRHAEKVSAAREPFPLAHGTHVGRVAGVVDREPALERTGGHPAEGTTSKSKQSGHDPGGPRAWRGEKA